MTDYSAALIDARKQLASAEAAAALHDWALALTELSNAALSLYKMRESIKDLQAAQNEQRAS